MELHDLWFILITVLFVGFFFLEGFDYGVGILHPFIAKNDKERRLVLNSIGPVWDANEVWLLTAGGAMFAAFPHWYATMFSGFYLALFVILVGLILRGVSFEFRSKRDNPNWRRMWDYALFVGSLIPALLFGVAFANIVRGLAIDQTMSYTGTFFDLLNPYSLLGGLVTLTLFILHGALFLEMKVDGVVRDRVKAVARPVWLVATLLTVGFVAYSFPETEMFTDVNMVQIAALAIAVLALLTAGYMVFQKRYPAAFLSNSLAIVFVVVLLFASLYPNVMISTIPREEAAAAETTTEETTATQVTMGETSDLDGTNNITVEEAASSPYTLKIMTFVALFFVPLVLLYQGWSYWVFRKRLTLASEMEY